MHDTPQLVRWKERGTVRTAHWHSESGFPPPRRVVVAGHLAPAQVLEMLHDAHSILLRTDFTRAQRLVRAVDKEIQARQESRGSDQSDYAAVRADRAERAAWLSRIVVELGKGYELQLRNAPDDVVAACEMAYGPFSEVVDGDSGHTLCVSMNELIGVVSAYQWHLTGVFVQALGTKIYPRHGVFSPTRSEYVDLVADTLTSATDIPSGTAWDIGTGTGVLAAVLGRDHRFAHVTATDLNPRAVACANDNIGRLGLVDRVDVVEADLFPDGSGRADLILFNPPWLPGKPSSQLETGIYDPGSTVLHRFIDEVGSRLNAGGEAWLIISDLAEILELRAEGDIETRVEAAGLRIVSIETTRPTHPRVEKGDGGIPEARRREVTKLFRLSSGS